MKILWVTNVPVPEASQLMGSPSTPFGGWLVESARLLAERPNIDLVVAYPGPYTGEWQGRHISFRQFSRLDTAYLPTGWHPPEFGTLLDSLQPDIVHIFGTEFSHSLAMVNACSARGIKFAISIQGLVSVSATHYSTGLPGRVVYRHTVRDLIRRDSISQQQQKLSRRGQLEVRALKKAKHIVGRTTWDQACVARVNPSATYHHCNEILRPDFFQGQWDSEQCTPYTLFTSQGSYPIKGLHLLLEALAGVSEEFPEAQLLVAGTPAISSDARGRFLESSYSKYLRELCQRYQLEDRVQFMGPRSAAEMRKAMLSANAFILPSTIENSPNSLGEAMLLGMPVVASYVGGVPNFIEHGIDGYLYQADAPYMLAYYIRRLFIEPRDAQGLGHRARERALRTFDAEQNTSDLIAIYHEVAQDELP